jgi:hypothetical protein
MLTSKERCEGSGLPPLDIDKLGDGKFGVGCSKCAVWTAVRAIDGSKLKMPEHDSPHPPVPVKRRRATGQRQQFRRRSGR